MKETFSRFDVQQTNIAGMLINVNPWKRQFFINKRIRDLEMRNGVSYESLYRLKIVFLL